MVKVIKWGLVNMQTLYTVAKAVIGEPENAATHKKTGM